ncbi:hypothetical protein B7486_06990 [cyanobacterium TDX16]|nr:hypothetical protein B7486_06990 [cyanobacterium TDX16]
MRHQRQNAEKSKRRKVEIHTFRGDHPLLRVEISCKNARKPKVTYSDTRPLGIVPTLVAGLGWGDARFGWFFGRNAEKSKRRNWGGWRRGRDRENASAAQGVRRWAETEMRLNLRGAWGVVS